MTMFELQTSPGSFECWQLRQEAAELRANGGDTASMLSGPSKVGRTPDSSGWDQVTPRDLARASSTALDGWPGASDTDDAEV